MSLADRLESSHGPVAAVARRRTIHALASVAKTAIDRSMLKACTPNSLSRILATQMEATENLPTNDANESTLAALAEHGLRLFRLPVLCAIAVTLAGFLGRVSWTFELASHFRFQCCWFLLIGGAILAVGRHWRFAMLATVFGLVNLALVAPVYFGGRVPAGSKPSLRVMSLNVLTSNRDSNEVLQTIQSTDPDIVFLYEVDEQWMTDLEPLREDYPHQHAVPRPDNFGIVMYSRVNFAAIEVVGLAETPAPTVLAGIDHDDERIVVIGTHVFPPAGERRFRLRNHQLKHLGQIAAECRRPTILVGDLNVTPWSPFFTDLLRQSNLLDSRQGHGNQASWSRYGIGLPIDHCLVSPDVVVHRRWIEPVEGSDHDAVLVDISIHSAAIE